MVRMFVLSTMTAVGNDDRPTLLRDTRRHHHTPLQPYIHDILPQERGAWQSAKTSIKAVTNPTRQGSYYSRMRRDIKLRQRKINQSLTTTMLIITNIHYSTEYNSTNITSQWQPQNENNSVFQAHNYIEDDEIAHINNTTLDIISPFSSLLREFNNDIKILDERIIKVENTFEDDEDIHEPNTDIDLDKSKLVSQQAIINLIVQEQMTDQCKFTHIGGKLIQVFSVIHQGYDWYRFGRRFVDRGNSHMC